MKAEEEVSLVFSLVMRFNKPPGLGMSLVHQKGGRGAARLQPTHPLPPKGN